MFRHRPRRVWISLIAAGMSVELSAQVTDENSILPGQVDSSYFTPWAVSDTITSGFLDGLPFASVFGYPSITAIDIDRSRKSGVIQADRRFQLYPGRTLLHCRGDTTVRMRLSPQGVESLLAILNDGSNYDAEELACIFLPRHTFTFVDGAGALAVVVELCFECGQISMLPDHSARSGRTTLTAKALADLETLCSAEGLFPECVRTACWAYFERKK